MNIVESFERSCIILPYNKKLYIDDAHYSNKFRKNLLSSKDIRCNGYHHDAIKENSIIFIIWIISFVSNKKQIKEKLLVLPSHNYYSFIKMIKSNIITNFKFINPKNFILCHDRIGGAIMLRRIINIL